jgi:hypothetical protein
MRHCSFSFEEEADEDGWMLPAKTCFKNLTLGLTDGDVLGIIGPNGCGKTTLLRMLIGELTPETGHVKLGKTVKIGYNKQTRDDLDDDKELWREICGPHDVLDLGDGTSMPARQYVGQFNFRGADQMKPIGALSGGERNRVLLAKSMREGCNVILLGVYRVMYAVLFVLHNVLSYKHVVSPTLTHARSLPSFWTSRRADERFGRRHDALVGGGFDVAARRGNHCESRPLVSRPRVHAHSGAGRQR